MRKLVMMALGVASVSAQGLGASPWVNGSVTFERPVRSSQAIVAGESVWRCEGATCRGRAPAHLKSAERYCRELARWAGRVGSFQAGATAFDAEALRRCNGRR